MQFFRTLTAAGLIAAAATAPVAAAEISGAGSSFAYPIYAKWIEAYKKETGVAVDYRSVGSADGIRQVQSKEITFGASDMPLGARELEANGLIQFPTVVAGVVVVVNVEGSSPASSPSTAPPWLGSFSARSGRGTTPRSASSIPMPSCRRRPSWWCAAPTAPAPPSRSPIISAR